MFSIGERVMHPGQGLCTVVGFEDSPSPMLILEAGSGRGAARLMYPAAQAEKNLHPPVSRDEALAAIDGYGDLACDSFSDRNSGLEEKHFKQRLKLGIPESLRVTKTMLERIAAAEACSKKPSSYLARVLRDARERSLEELACALDTTPEEVEGMFEERGHALEEQA